MAAAGILFVPAGCSSKPQKPKTPIARYPTLPLRKVPDYMKNTIIERTELGDDRPYLVSGFGLVANLHDTGNSDAPNAVRDYIIKEMTKHKWGSKLLPNGPPVTAEEALRDPRFAIVRVDGYLPPGIRKDHTFDVQVSAIAEGYTTSLAHGDLYQTDLRIRGASNQDPGGSVNVYARCQGPVFVNPAYALTQNPDDPAAKRSLRYGVIMDGGRAMDDRPLLLRLFQPQRSLARGIERRINQRFQQIADKPRVSTLSAYCVSEAQDEGIVFFYVPEIYRGDWQHFAAVVMHLYLNESPEFADLKAKELAAEALKPEAPLADISLAWEGLGQRALPYIRDLMSNPAPEISYASARAAAFIGDPTAPRILAQMAGNAEHPFQLAALETLGKLPTGDSPAINEMIRPLLDSPQTLVRIQAYQILADHKDGSIFSKVIRDKFVLDIVHSSGPPIVFCTRRGIPRVAIIGDRAALNVPIIFTTMGGRFSISTNEDQRTLSMFYRPPALPKSQYQPPPVRVHSNPDLAEIIARLGGEGSESGPAMDFNYGDVVSILNEITANQRVTALSKGQRMAAAFVMQELPQNTDSIYSAPVIPDQSRPQTEATPGNVGMAR